MLSGTEEYFDALARCRYVISNDDMQPFFRKREGQVYLQTWHGTPLKKIGFDIGRPQFASGTAYFDRLAADIAQVGPAAVAERVQHPDLAACVPVRR